MKKIFSRLRAVWPAIQWRSLLIGFLTVILPVTVFHYLSSGEENSSAYAEHVISTGDLSETIKVSGQAELVDEQKLRFNLTGKVTGVYFSDGDSVKKDQIIAELDKSQLESDIKQAEINLQNSQLTLKNLLEGSTASQILKAENSVSDTGVKISMAEQNLKIAENDYKVTLQNLDDELQSAKDDVDEKERALELAQQSLTIAAAFKEMDDKSAVIDYNAAMSEALADVHSVLIEMQDILIKVDEVMGVSDERKRMNDSYEKYLGASDSVLKNTTFNQIKGLLGSFPFLSEQFEAISAQDSPDASEVSQLIDDTLVFLNEATSAFENYYHTVENSVATIVLPQSQIDSYKSAALGYVKNAKSESDQILGVRDMLPVLKTPEIVRLQNQETYDQKESSVTSAQLSLKKSQNTLKNLEDTIDAKKESARLSLVSSQNDLNNLKNTLQIDQADLADLLKGADEEDIAKARNDVTQKELALERVKTDTEKYEIITPFDGIVRQIDYKSGDNILSDDDKFVYIENPNLLRIEILLDQIDIVKVHEGQKANIVFDALPEEAFVGSVDEVSRTPVENSGVVSYSVTITLNTDGNNIFSGMTAEVEVVLNEVTDVVLVPNSAIRTQGTRKTVLVRSADGSSRSVDIETGETDGKNTEVKSGLKEGDVVLELALTANSSVNQTGEQRQNSGFGGGVPPAGAVMRTLR